MKDNLPSTTATGAKRKADNHDARDRKTSSFARKSEIHKKRIYLNAFDMFTVGHLSHGQWKSPGDKSATKRRDLTYWTNLAMLLEEGDFNALFLADSYGFNETYKGSAEPAIREGCQFPMGDPSVVRLSESTSFPAVCRRRDD